MLILSDSPGWGQGACSSDQLWELLPPVHGPHFEDGGLLINTEPAQAQVLRLP